jgi:hypothetical protein
MQVAALTQVDREKALELWQKYQTHKHYQTEADAEIATIYKRIAQGKTVIRALESIRAAGLNQQGMPKLAICKADTQICYFHRYENRCEFHSKRWARSDDRRSMVKMDWQGLRGQDRNGEAIVPIVPVHLRPKRGLANYHILWEAEWTKLYPADPYLLRRIGGDAWLVVAAWDLTDVERAVMSQRLRN